MSGAWGARLREERARIGLNQADFSRLGGVSRGSQVDYESGRGAPNAEYLARIADAGIDVLYLITGERAAGDISSAEARLLDLFRRADDEWRAMILSLLTKATGTGATIHEPKDQSDIAR